MKRPQTFTVLVLDDEPAVRSALAAGGFAAIEVRTAEEAVHLVRHQSFDLVLLDMSVPGGSGIEACWRIRAIDPRAGIVLVTRPEEDKAQAFEAGADYCLTKPTQCRELVACFHAVLRRTLPDAIAEAERVKAGKLELDFERRTLWKAGMEVHLSPKEFDLLALFMGYEGIPLAQEYLLSEAWGASRARQPRHLRAYIKRLRQKIEDDPKQPRCILTEPRFGYCFHSPAGTNGIVPQAGQQSTDLSGNSRTTDSPGAASFAEFPVGLTPRPAACALGGNSRATDSLDAAASPEFLSRLAPPPAACTTNSRSLSAPRRFRRVDFSPRGASPPLFVSETEASRGRKPALHDLVAAVPPYALSSRYAFPFRSSARSQSRLIALSIRDLREEIRANAVSFPSQTPVFYRHDRPDLQWKLVQLYFVRGWSCASIGLRYQITPGRVRGILKTWKRRAIETGYVQYIPPAEVLQTAMPKDSPEAPKLSETENGQSAAYLDKYSTTRNTLRQSRFRPLAKGGPARLHGL